MTETTFAEDRSPVECSECGSTSVKEQQGCTSSNCPMPVTFMDKAKHRFPRLDDVVQPDDVSKLEVKDKNTGRTKYTADYVNWARIAHYLREHAPGWQPFMERTAEGLPYHLAPDGSVYLLIGFRHPDPAIPDTEVVVHAIMDAKNEAKNEQVVDARDISDAYVRGMCKAAALLFGLGWKLWSKDDPMTRAGGAGSGTSTDRTKPTQKQVGMFKVQQEKLAEALGSEAAANDWLRDYYREHSYPAVEPSKLDRKQLSGLIDSMIAKLEAVTS